MWNHSYRGRATAQGQGHEDRRAEEEAHGRAQASEGGARRRDRVLPGFRERLPGDEEGRFSPGLQDLRGPRFPGRNPDAALREPALLARSGGPLWSKGGRARVWPSLYGQPSFRQDRGYGGDPLWRLPLLQGRPRDQELRCHLQVTPPTDHVRLKQ